MFVVILFRDAAIIIKFQIPGAFRFQNVILVVHVANSSRPAIQFDVKCSVNELNVCKSYLIVLN